MSYNIKIQSLLTIPEKISKNRIQRCIVTLYLIFNFGIIWLRTNAIEDKTASNIYRNFSIIEKK